MSFSGFNLGSSNTPRYGSGVSFDGIDTGATFYGQQPIDKAGKYAFIGSSLYKNADPETRRLIAENELGNKSQSAVAQLLNFAREARSPEARKQALQDTLDFQNAQQASAAPYNLLNKGLENLAKIPDRIAQQSALQTANTLLGARSITDAYTNTLANYPKLQFASNVPVVQSGKYFS
jgi:hypothetical protein